MRNFILTAALLAPAAASAQSVQAVQPWPGYVCAMLNVSDAVMRDGPLPVIMADDNGAPSNRPLMTGGGPAVAGMTVIVASPAVARDGLMPVLHLDGRPGWIDAMKVRTWRSRSDPNARCSVWLMSDGKPGFR